MGTRLTEQPHGKCSQTRNQRLCYNSFFFFSTVHFPWKCFTMEEDKLQRKRLPRLGPSCCMAVGYVDIPGDSHPSDL